MDADLQLDDSRINAELQRLRDLPARDARGAMAAIGRYLKTSTQLRFRSQQGPDGQRWWPSNRAKKEGGQTLRDSGDLFGSITWRATPTSAEVGTNKRYARVHQFGIRKIVSVPSHRRMTKGRNKAGGVSVKSSTVRAHPKLMFMPRRPFLGFNAADRSRILDILRQRLARAAGK